MRINPQKVLTLSLRLGVFYGRRSAESIKELSSQCVRPPTRPNSEKCTERGPLPWETDERQKYIDRQNQGIECDDLRPQSVIDSFKSNWERRKMERGRKEFERIAIIRKTYPHVEAEKKPCVPGCPVAGWQLLNSACHQTHSHQEAEKKPNQPDPGRDCQLMTSACRQTSCHLEAEKRTKLPENRGRACKLLTSTSTSRQTDCYLEAKQKTNVPGYPGRNC
ncbi:uncharacterized protein LOC126883381 [Diabrotica virgifera virgifera]|uniref:Uncharacterized protein LOC114344515 n=1 Tax=Diabrotica virgifera virgifera TaxID=50390 RepID=A0A6P7GND4_DIAVI|nr:uncharacterized protein LOC126883381 [Diabrotica virgifera virgifera]